MFSLRQFFLAAWAVSMVAADCPTQNPVMINSDADAKNMLDQSCTKLDASIVFGKGVVNISLDNLVSITGDFTCTDATQLSSISAAKLRNIGGTFGLMRLTSLKSLVFPELVSVGQIDWETLPALEGLEMTKQITQARRVLITDTIMTSLNGINITSTAYFNINNNRFLRNIDCSLQEVSDMLDINSNGKSLKASFPDLTWANNITIRDASSVSFPMLEKVNSSCSFINNTFDSISFPELTQVGGSFSFAACPSLTNITASKVKSIGGTFLIANNSNLAVLEGFGSVTKVGGSVDFAGKFTNCTLPDLDDVRGSFNFQTTETFSCDQFNKLRDTEVVKGEYICEDKKATAQSLTTSGLDTVGDSKNKDSGAGRTTISIILAAITAATGLMFL
jgi:hypothetical protein